MNIFEEIKERVQKKAYDHFVQHHPELLAHFLAEEKDTYAINKLAYYHETKVRHAIADCPLLAPEAILHLVKDESDSIRRKAVTNPAISPEAKAYIIANTIELTPFAKHNPSVTLDDAEQVTKIFPNLIHSFVENQSSNEEILSFAIAFLNKNDIKLTFFHNIVTHKNCTTKILHQLFDDVLKHKDLLAMPFFNDFLKHHQADKALLMKWLTFDTTESQIKRAQRRGDILKEMKRRNLISKKEMMMLVKNIQARDHLV